MTDDFDKLLSFDPLAEAEQVTGQSYKDDEVTKALGFIMALQHNDEKAVELGLRDDSYYNIAHDEYLRIVEDLGFTLVFTEAFGPDEAYQVYWRRGVLLTVESYGEALNSAKAYFNMEFREGESPWAYRLSGRVNGPAYDKGRTVWVGDFDAREGLRHQLARLEAAGTFLEPWVEQPFLWLLNYMETRGEYDHALITSMKLDRLPVEVQAAICHES